MPFKSSKQQRFMYAKHPEIAKRWTDEAKAKGVSACPTCKGKGMVAVNSKSTRNAMTKCKDCDGEGMTKKGGM